MTYTFENLSPIEFTELVRDLMWAKERKDFSISPEGPDGGIDIAWFGPKEKPEVVIQCKRYIKSSTTKLISDIKKELDKVKRLDPERYVIATNKSLTADNKRDLEMHFSPYVKSRNDIFGGDDLNSLLRVHPEVLSSHHKLWFHSAILLKKILSLDTGFLRVQQEEDIKQLLKLYVQIPSFAQALEKLKERRIVIISGSPGIGKSTLAKMLLLHHVNQDYRVHELEDLGANWNEFPLEGRIVLFYDDFLGRSVWRDNADADTEKRFERIFDIVEKNSRLRLILTTRKYLIPSAQTYLDASNRWITALDEVEIKLTEFSRATKARMLYNHLYFNNVAPEYCRALAGSSVLQKVLSHKNYVPRIIESVTNRRNWPPSLSPNEYHSYILGTLDSPRSLYGPVIRDRINTMAREMLYVLYCRQAKVASLNTLENDLQLFRAALDSTKFSRGEFKNSLKELTGSLIEITNGYNGVETASFLNPGVIDSVRESIWTDSLHWESLLTLNTHPGRFFQLALCCPELAEASSLKIPAELPESWFENLRHAALNSLNVSRFFEDIAQVFSLNVWKGRTEWLSALFTEIHDRSDVINQDKVDWTCLVAYGVQHEINEAISSLVWMTKEMKRSVRSAVEKNGFTSIHFRASNLRGAGLPGERAWRVLTKAASKEVQYLLTPDYDFHGRPLKISEQAYDDAKGIIEVYKLDHLVGLLNKTEYTPYPDDQEDEQEIFGKSPQNEDDDLNDSEIMELFASLAQVSAEEFSHSIRGY